MINQPSKWNSWSATDEASPGGTSPAARQAPAAPAGAAAGATGTRATVPPPALRNDAVIADLARQARAARNDLQVAQETFARRALLVLETLRTVDRSLVDLAVHVLGNEVIAAHWFISRNLHCGQRAPLELLAVTERSAVVNELMRLEHGMY